jgi:hypothetical protein
MMNRAEKAVITRKQRTVRKQKGVGTARTCAAAPTTERARRQIRSP